MLFRASLLALMLLSSTAAHAIRVAVYADRDFTTVNIINSHFGSGSATLVNNNDLSVPGFLTSFDAFYFTRRIFSTGLFISTGPSLNVMDYVGSTGNVVLLNGNFLDVRGTFDTPGNAFLDTLIVNAVKFAAASGHGYIGELNGAIAGLTANSEANYNPLGLIAGAAGPLGLGNGGTGTSVNLAPAGVGHAMTEGLILPINPEFVGFGAVITGVDPSLVLATWDGGNPAIIARTGTLSVAEPGTLLLAAAGLLLLWVGSWQRPARRSAVSSISL